MKLMITGHRPNRLGGYGMDSPIVKSIDVELRKIVSALDPDTDVVICGMAQGVDQLFAEICMEFGIPVHAYIPFDGQESRWPDRAKSTYRSLLHRCADVVICSCHPSKSAFLRRNAVMVKAADRAIAVWDGSPGGTGATVSMIKLSGKDLHVISV